MPASRLLRSRTANASSASSIGVALCRFTPGSTKYGERFPASKPLRNTYRKVGSRKAQYRVWAGECFDMKTQKRYKKFTQREWYLPQSKILIADGWSIPGLEKIIASASWK